MFVRGQCLCGKVRYQTPNSPKYILIATVQFVERGAELYLPLG